MSHTAMMLLAGIVLLVVIRLIRRDPAQATRLFLILWLIASVGNLLVGVFHAGYGWSEEAAIWLLVFGLPAAIALAARRLVG